ncbi:hypothetical protein [Streptomyces sp. NPDC006925]|uniref:hypothetical protein n=1 Tax=Streptomyces sp. NPDC006925 TaxID=3364768 RepID=UPI00367FBED2
MGISGFRPSFLTGVETIQRAHGSRLAALAGRRLTGFALVRFAEDGDWFAECPVVLDFNGIQAEICHTKFDELSIGWDTIDIRATVAGWEWFEFTPQWSYGDERLEPLIGQELCEVALLEWRPPGRGPVAGSVTLEFVFAEDCLRIANGLDENRIETGATQPPPPGCIRHRPGH